ncbi:lipocalin family protein [Myroides sp.]|uniref:lipocalin family protein n=1 Tax=Myroides sp. TaxID=1874736 RepID=UPI003F37AE94
MKKVLFALLLSIVMIVVSSCNEKETKEVYEKENLIGTWELAWTKTYDREVKFLEDIVPTDDYGCGLMTWAYTVDKLDIINYIGKDESGKCLEQMTSLTYTLKDNNISTKDDQGVEEGMLITNLTKDELVVMTTLPNPIEENRNTVKYVELGYKRVK